MSDSFSTSGATLSLANYCQLPQKHKLIKLHFFSGFPFQFHPFFFRHLSTIGNKVPIFAGNQQVQELHATTPGFQGRRPGDGDGDDMYLVDTLTLC